MSERRRNLAVGLTVIVALCMLGGMVVIFTGLPELFAGGYEVRMTFDSTSDAHKGDPIHMSGMRVGRITDVGFTNNDPRQGVTFTARIDRHIRIPGNANVYIFSKGFVGGSYMEFKADGPNRHDASGRIMDFLPTDRVITIRGQVKGSGLIPDELTEGMRSLTRLADNLNNLIAPPPAAATTATAAATTTAASGPAVTIEGAGLQSTIAKLNRTLDAFYEVVGDQDNQRNLKASLANLKTASERATEAMDSVKGLVGEANKTLAQVSATAANANDKINQLSQKLITDAEQVSELMTTMNRAVTKIDKGEGTFGQLLNDPKLYNNLLDATQRMGQVMSDMRQLIEEWKKQGIKMKL